MPSAKQELPDFQGAVIEGGLRLMDCLGSGTWGKVYRAIDMLSPVDRPAFYAVKCMLKPEPDSFEDQLQTREFTNHAYVSDHPNIVTFHRYFSDDKFTYVVLDLCTGGDLFQAVVLRDQFFQRTDRIKIAFLQVLNAVHHCHQRGVFHRDLKPENILYSAENEEYFVADFGLSTSSTSSMDFRCGSWEYMSPECIGKDFKTGRQYSTRTNDVWALGVILVNMITKRAPWTRARPSDPCFSAFMTDDCYFLRVLAISEETNDLLKRVFTIEPYKRITIPELRREIIALDTFFPDGCEDGALVPIHADDTSPRTSTCLRRSNFTTSPTPALSCEVGGVLDIGDSFIDRIAVLHVSRLASLPPANPFLTAPCSLESAPSSRGPITPETHPAQVPVDIEIVPDIDESVAVRRSSKMFDFRKPAWIREVSSKSAWRRSKFFKKLVGRVSGGSGQAAEEVAVAA